MANLRVGAYIRGAEVIRVEDNMAYLGVGAKCDGKIYLEFFTSDKNVRSLKDLIKEGDKIDVEVSKVTSENVFLSRLGIEEKEKRDKIIRKIMNRHPFEATVTGSNADGLFLEKDGVRLFCPNNYVDLNPEFDKSSLKINGSNENIVITELSKDDPLLDKLVFNIPWSRVYKIVSAKIEADDLTISYHTNNDLDAKFTFRKISKSMYWNPKLKLND